MDRAPKSIPKPGSLISMYRTVILPISVPVIYRVKKRFPETSVEIIHWLRGSMNTKHLIWMLSHWTLKDFPFIWITSFQHSHTRVRWQLAGIFIKTVGLIRKTDFPRTVKKVANISALALLAGVVDTSKGAFSPPSLWLSWGQVATSPPPPSKYLPAIKLTTSTMVLV